MLKKTPSTALVYLNQQETLPDHVSGNKFNLLNIQTGPNQLLPEKCFQYQQFEIYSQLLCCASCYYQTTSLGHSQQWLVNKHHNITKHCNNIIKPSG